MNSGGILQTPDFFIRKGIMAESLIGRHLLLALTFENGIAFGMRFDSRRNQPMQWIKPITSNIVLAGWGEYVDFMSINQYARNLAQGLEKYIGSSYVTLPYISKFLSSFVKEKFENSIPFALDMLLVDVLSQKLCFVGLQGSVVFFKNFGILGGYQYIKAEPSTDMPQEEMEKLILFPRKEVLKYLNNVLEKGEKLKEKNAVKILSETLFTFDPPSKKENFEIVIYQNENFKSFIVKTK